MGGLGKTTIAQAVFRRIAHKFEGSSFVKNVRKNSSNEQDICGLQEKILKDILMMHHIMINDCDQGAEMIQRYLSTRKVLLVLDDVQDIRQKEFLAATHEWFGPGSRIIITTRDEHLLADSHFKYKPNCLLMDQAVKLFSRHAFKRNRPLEGYEELTYRAINYTGCLPLALKVLGSFFRGRQANVWKSALNKLSKAPNIEIFETLKLSFDGLDNSEKNIFLDIACFFKGKGEEHVTRILDSFGFDPVIGISVLIERCLITISKRRLDMHDLIQEMGWQIVRGSYPNSRLWQPEEMHDLIMSNRKLKEIEAIVLHNRNFDQYDEKLGLSSKVFKKMKKLRLLDIDSNFPCSEPNFLPNEIRWLCWHEYPFSSLPLACMRKLVGLELKDATFQHLWVGLEILPNLKLIDLRGSRYMTRIPDISGAPNLESLIVADCMSLVELHPSLGFHQKLGYLDLSGCKQLECFPSRIEMESLETLILSYCNSLVRFPDVSPCMVKLSKIYMDHCGHIEELPSSIRFLSGLTILNLRSCKKLQKLPEELGSMERLEDLLLGLSEWGCAEIQQFLSFQYSTSFCSLRKLDLSWRQIEEEDFPKNFHAFSSLEELNLSGNSKLIQLPAGISHLTNLKLLELNKCPQLRSLLQLPSGLQVLKAQGCSSLETIGDVTEEYEWLYKLWFLDCHKLLEDQDNRRYIEKMLQQSSLKKCAVLNHRLSIAIPGSKIPSWFKEQQHGCNIALKLPPKWHTQIIGFAICGVFHGDWKYSCPRIIFKIINDERIIPKSEVDHNVPTAADHGGNTWLSYIPLDFFQRMYHDFQPQDWYHVEGTLVLTIMRSDRKKSVRCGAHAVYKDDVELIHQLKTCIPDYGNLVQVDRDNNHGDLGYEMESSANTYVYEETSDDNNSNLVPPRTSQRRNIYNRPYGYVQGPYRNGVPFPKLTV